MNIFEILTKGHGSIKETEISSLLAYLLYPYEDHGMGSLFLIKLYELIKKWDSDYYNFQKILKTKNLTIELEYMLNDRIDNRIDIFLEINNKRYY
jgi:hypothetical protein